MQDKAELRRAGENLLRLAFLRGHIPEDIYVDRDSLMSWWNNLSEEKRKFILDDCHTFVEALNTQQRREEWYKNRFKNVGWRLGLAVTLPGVVAIRWLLYASGSQKWWALAIWIGGGIIMRLLINFYDKLRDNPRELPDELDRELKEQSLFRIFDWSLIIIGLGLIVGAALISSSGLLIAGLIIFVIGCISLFFRTRFLKKGKFNKGG